MVRKDADVELLVNGGVGQVEVPDVVTDHMTLEEAQQAIEDAGLHSQVENVADDEVEEGRVISTNPKPGTMVDSGSTVTLRVSTGPAEEMVTVPDGLVGDTLANVSAKLEEAGLTYSVIGDESDSSITVTAQVPEAGGAVPKDGQVVLYTNGYDEASTYVTVPSFLGYDVTNASYLASINGLQISVSGSSSSTATVTAQSVTEGEQVQQGTVITLTFVDNANAETGATAGG